jgi:hypothetical protein
MLLGGMWSFVTLSTSFPQIAQIGMVLASRIHWPSLYSHRHRLLVRVRPCTHRRPDRHIKKNVQQVPDAAEGLRWLGAEAPIPPWHTAGSFFSITRTADELSVVCRQDAVPEGVLSEQGWRCLRVAGAMPFSVVGVLASLTAPLAEAGFSVFAISTSG